MKYFEKIAVGPAINITKDPTKSFGGMYISAKTIKDLDTSKDFKSILPKIFLKKSLNV